jgi:hypothetical protein
MAEGKTNKNKAKGNAYERKVAKELSLWIFDDEHMLKREPSSGAQKHSFTGDIFPYKQIPWKRWPIHIETKSGYEDSIPTFHNYKKVESWFRKALEESKLSGQHCILLICQFKHRNAIVISNTYLTNLLFSVCFPIKVDNDIMAVYVYDYKELLKLNFEDTLKFEDLI